MAEVKHIIRIANTDLKGHKAVSVAMTKIRGVSFQFAKAACNVASIDSSKMAGALNEGEVKKLNDIIAQPAAHGFPTWMLNRRKDYDTGEDKHLITGDLQYQTQQDIRRLQKIKSYKGFRHQAGLPVRGQRTKSNFRRNKGKAVGVKKKSGAKSGRV